MLCQVRTLKIFLVLCFISGDVHRLKIWSSRNVPDTFKLQKLIAEQYSVVQSMGYLSLQYRFLLLLSIASECLSADR